jgi:hypothetical protein
MPTSIILPGPASDTGFIEESTTAKIGVPVDDRQEWIIPPSGTVLNADDMNVMLFWSVFHRDDEPPEGISGPVENGVMDTLEAILEFTIANYQFNRALAGLPPEVF